MNYPSLLFPACMHRTRQAQYTTSIPFLSINSMHLFYTEKAFLFPIRFLFIS